MQPPPFDVPDEALSESFLAASGPGGQNVNKVATACQLRADVYKLGLHPEVFQRLKIIAGSRMTAGGELIITARRFRTQEANRADARARLAQMLAAAHRAPKKRKATRPTKSAKAKRVEVKKQRGEVKSARSKVRLD